MSDSLSPFVAIQTDMPSREKVVIGVGWALVGAALRYALAGATVLALTRILQPEELGLVALTYVVLELVGHVATVGFHDALIQKQDLDESDLDTAFWSIVTVSGFFVLLVIVAAPVIAHEFGHYRLAPLMIVMALAAFVHALSIVPRALLTRRMDFRVPALVRVVGMILGGVCAVTLALLGAGPWSRVFQFVVLHVVSTVLIWRLVGWRPGWRVTRLSLRRLWRFAPSVSVFTVFVYVMHNADDQLVGYVLGPEQLGYYALAYSFMAWPVRDVIGSGQVVLYPVLARYQDDLSRFQEVYLEGLQLATLFAFPVLVVMIVAAPVFVPWLVGDRWSPAVLPMQVLAFGGIREVTMMLNGSVYRALGRPELHMMLSVASVVCYLVGFVVGLDYGIGGVAFFFVFVGFLLHGVSLWMVLSCLRLSFFGWARVLVVPLVLLGLVGLVGSVALYVVFGDFGVFVRLLLFGLVCVLVYVVSLIVLDPGVFVRLGGVLGGLVRLLVNDYAKSTS
ncbi:MAG: lipopolysaccharide biosynthesis protein [Chloroflexi bacterium]|nr:lipopolysaccharide biosynthesis protein [Chloroflexota bacterium]